MFPMSIKCSKIYTKNAYHYVCQQRELISCNNEVILDKLIVMMSKLQKTETENKDSKKVQKHVPTDSIQEY